MENTKEILEKLDRIEKLLNNQKNDLNTISESIAKTNSNNESWSNIIIAGLNRILAHLKA